MAKKRSKFVLVGLLILIIMAVVVIIGYSVMTPIINFFRNNDGQDLSGGDDPWTPPISEQRGEDETDAPVTEEEGPDDTDDQADTPDNMEERFSAYYLSASALESEEALREGVSRIKSEGYTAVTVVMKDKGGSIYYDTASEMAKSSVEDAIKSTLPASLTAGIIKEAGLTAIASVNILEDHNRYGAARDGSYRFQNDNSTWLDNRAESGGKPWLSPFATETQSYVAILINEISSAGFDIILCDGIVFPNFRSSDLGYIGPTVSSENRYSGLINIFNIAKSAAKTSGADVYLQVSAQSVINGTAEVLKPDELDGDVTVVIYYSGTDFGNTFVYEDTEIILSDMSTYEKLYTIYSIAKQKTGDLRVIPFIDYASMNSLDIDEAITAVMDLGFEAYIVK